MQCSIPRVLPETTHLGRIRLAVSDLSRSLRFYEDILGLRVIHSSGKSAELTANHSSAVLIELEEIEGVKPLAQGSRLGLYHYALLLPSRGALASFAEHLVSRAIRFGSADHLVSEALYLQDPDGIQIEVYSDRPRAAWTYDRGELQMGVERLRFEDLFGVPHPTWNGAPPETILGHVHFHVGDLEMARKFYCEGLGFDAMAWSYPGALFVSAGGYHHHIGLNIWAEGSPVARPTDARLLSWELVLESESQVIEATDRLKTAGFSALVDPWKIKLVLTSLRS
jgi:catechol 2,3-dioxygenase